MDADTPRRPWWKRRRWIATAVTATAIAYPLSFVPACWLLTRPASVTRPAARDLLRRGHAPTARLLMACPAAVRRGVGRLIEAGSPAGFGMHVGPDSIELIAYIDPDRPPELAGRGLGIEYMSVRRVW